MLGVLMRKDVTGHPKRLAMPTLNVNYVPVVECKLTYQVSNYYIYTSIIIALGCCCIRVDCGFGETSIVLVGHSNYHLLPSKSD